MFGFGKKKVSQADEQMIAAFKEANASLTSNVAAIQKIEGMIKTLDRDLSTVEKSVVAIAQTVNLVCTRLQALEDQLSVKDIKFINN